MKILFYICCVNCNETVENMICKRNAIDTIGNLTGFCRSKKSKPLRNRFVQILRGHDAKTNWMQYSWSLCGIKVS